MSKKIILSVMLLTTGFLVNTPSMAVQSESPVACIESPTSTVLVYGDHTTGCEIDSPLDFDAFIFDGVIGDVIRINLRTEGALDGRVEIFDPSGIKISNGACNAGSAGCSEKLSVTLAATGQYGINITDLNSTQFGPYTLQLEGFPPTVPPPSITYGVTTDINPILPSTDMDTFAFEGISGSSVRVNVRTLDQLDGRLEILDPNGVEIFDSWCNAGTSGCVVTTDQTLTVDGTYLIIVSDINITQIGDFEVSLQCLFGCAPPLPRAECDIQLNQTTYLDGETVTANVFRYANDTGAAVALEWKVWLGIPGIPPIEIINIGADGSFVLPDGTDVDLGPLPLLPVTAALPRGDYEFSCRFLDPTTGRLLMEDRNFFDLQ